MSESSTTAGAVPATLAVVTLFTENLPETKQFYREVFGLEGHFEDPHSVVFKFSNMMVNLLKVEAAPELVEPAAVASPDAGSRSVFTIEVDDVDATCAKLADLGVKLVNGPMDRPWGIRTASFRDPGGQIWEIAK